MRPPLPKGGGEQPPPHSIFPLSIYFYITKNHIITIGRAHASSPPHLGEGNSRRRATFSVIDILLYHEIYFYITKKSHNNNRKNACVLPSPRWGGAGGEVD